MKSQKMNVVLCISFTRYDELIKEVEQAKGKFKENNKRIQAT